MKYSIGIFILLLLFTSCEEKKTEPPKPDYRPQNSNIPEYIGKFVYTDSTKEAITKLPYHTGSTVYVEVGCECGDEVGEHITSKASSRNIVQMTIGGDQVEFLKSLDKSLLQHLYFTYLYTDQGSNDANHPRARSGAVILSSFYDLEDKMPLEKLTVYTTGKSNSIAIVGTTIPNKAPAVDTTRVKIGKDTTHVATVSLPDSTKQKNKK